MANGRHSYVAFYPSDWVGGTARLPRLHRSVLFDVCCYIWDTAAPVPARELALMIADLPNGTEILSDLIEIGKLTRSEGGTFTNDKALHEATKAKAAWEAMSKGGKQARSMGDAKGDDKPHAKGDRENQNQNQNQKKKESPLPPKPKPKAGLPWHGVPDWIPLEAWHRFLKSRQTNKRQVDASAAEALIAKLDKFRAEGNDPGAVLDQSSESGWIGLFRIKEDASGRSQDFRSGGGASPDRRSSLARAIDEGLEQLDGA